MVGEKGRRSGRPPTIILRPGHHRELADDPAGKLAERNRKAAEDAALSEEQKAAIKDYRQAHPNKSNNASAIAKALRKPINVSRHRLGKPEWSESVLRKKIGALIKL